jgi:hypothetical protein
MEPVDRAKVVFGAANAIRARYLKTTRRDDFVRVWTVSKSA